MQQRERVRENKRAHRFDQFCLNRRSVDSDRLYVSAGQKTAVSRLPHFHHNQSILLIQPGEFKRKCTRTKISWPNVFCIPPSDQKRYKIHTYSKETCLVHHVFIRAQFLIGCNPINIPTILSQTVHPTRILWLDLFFLIYRFIPQQPKSLRL